MLDTFNIPNQQQNTTIFYGVGGAWQTWEKPRNAKLIEIFCLGGGAGGTHPTIGTPIGGGIGGGSGGIVKGIIPAFLLPDRLYILVGVGGTGGKTSGAGGLAGGISYVSLDGTTSEQTLICKSSTAAAAGTAGGTLSVVTLSAFGNLGFFTAIAGVNGGGGGTGTPTAGGNQTALGTNIITGGCGGGGHNAVSFSVGGSVIPAASILSTQITGGQTSGANGDNGYGFLQPFCGTGGAGGAGRTGSGVGGTGGNGYFGCGGGGGGAGSVQGGVGGDGGSGLVIITVL